MTGPTAFLRRTPMRRLLEQQGATWRNLPDAAVAETMPGIVRQKRTDADGSLAAASPRL